MAKECLSRVDRGLEVISMSKQTKMLMAQYYWISFRAEWHSIIGSFPEVDCLHWPQPDFILCHSCRKVNPYVVCGFLQIIYLHLFCCTAVWSLGIGSITQVLEVSVIGGTYTYPEGC